MSDSFMLLGAGGHAKVIADIIVSMKAELLGIYADASAGQALLDFLVLGDSALLIQHAKQQVCPFIVAIGDNNIRKKKYDYFLASGLRPGLCLHPSSVISRYAMLEQGTVVMAGAIINPGTAIGCNTIINTASSIDHDCTIGDHVHIAPNATLCGDVTVGNLSWIGAGATIIEGVTIGHRCMIAAGAVVIADVPDNTCVAGVPATRLKQEELL